ncbi:MAG: ABC transporter substrate-binding protein [Caldilineaceae bacterium]|nr:ABC transporter substrate-binding protein [Caldilineaceae bacterium]
MTKPARHLATALALLLTLLLVAACGARPTLPDVTPEAPDVEAPAAEAPADAEEAEAEATEPAAEEAAAEAPADADAKEAPMLAAMVAAGELPPLEERLPAEPLVVEPIESVGQYGGTWRRAFKGIADFHAYGRINYDPILRWPRNPSDPVQPGLAKEWSFNEDGTELTLVLREGLKWSDGAPFTTDDIVFWWEDIELDTNITPTPHAEWVVNGEPMTLEVIDDVTIKLKFAGPNGLAETVGLAFHGNQWPLAFERFGFFAPRHYLEQFHPKYNDEYTDYAMFEDMANDFNTERPVMMPWVITEFEPGGTEMLATRNPYYWKVDIEGRQLPYIDQVHFELVADNEAINLMALAGDIDMQSRGMDFSKITVFQENAEAGDYRVGLWSSASASNLSFMPNQSYSDPVYRELFQNVDFRVALSHAIDRDLINEIAYLGQGTPRTTTVVDASPYFQEDIVNLYGEFDPDQSKALLDEIGLPVGADGFRTFEDGTVIDLVIETQDTGAALDVIELVAENWNDIGLKTSIRSMTRDIYWPRAIANEVMIATWGTDRGLVPMVDPVYQFPFDERSWMAPSFGIWYKSGGTDGEEPPAYFKEVMDLYDQYRTTVDSAQQVEIGKQIVRLATEQLFVIPTVGMSPALVIAKNNFHNVIMDQSFVGDWIIMAPGTQDPSHYYFGDEE